MFLNALSELIQGASTPSISPIWQRDILSARSSPCITCTHNELLVAFLWKCRTIVLDLHPEEIVHLTYLINIRRKSFNFELPSRYYGNAFITPAALSKAGLLCSNPSTYICS
uniref:Uncharacterized protein n=1 Tax=Solanum lycopersicum TaxID=4081 RepID=A0A3Q7HGW2_SOLLC